MEDSQEILNLKADADVFKRQRDWLQKHCDKLEENAVKLHNELNTYRTRTMQAECKLQEIRSAVGVLKGLI